MINTEATINIKDLVLEVPKSEGTSLFNPDKYVTGREWNKLIGKLDKERENYSWNDFVGIATSLRVLFPDRVDQLRLDDEAWQKSKEYLEAVRQNSPSAYWRNATEVAILFPDRIHRLYEDQQNQDVMAGNLDVAIDRSLLSGQLDQYVKCLAALKFVFPDKLSEHNITSPIISDIKENLDMKRHDDDWAGYLDMARDLRLLLPDSRNLIDHDYAISQADRILIFLQERDSWFRYIGLVKDFAIIDAQTVEFTDQGLKITVSPQLFLEGIKAPERRKF